jgi:hypothetical protein
LDASTTILTSARWRITSPETLRGAPLLTYTSAFQMLQEAKWFQAMLSQGVLLLNAALTASSDDAISTAKHTAFWRAGGF